VDRRIVTESSESVPVSVVVPVRNGAPLLDAQLGALARQTFDGTWEIVVVDNGSTDATPELLATWVERLPRLRVTSSSSPPNASRARNAAAGAARGEILAFCDADDLVDERWLEALVNALDAADIVAGSLDIDLLNDETSRAWRSFALPSTAGEPAFGYLPYAVSANMAVKRAAFDAVGGFDPTIPGPGSEEIDLSWRIQQAGYTFGFAPDAVVAYRFRRGLRAYLRQQYRYGQGEAALYARHRAHMRRASRADLAAAVWFAVSRWHHTARGSALRGRYLGYLAYRAGRVIGGVRHGVGYW
jgi:glycosyltransferase involved in cell wall biosynthesis